MKNIIIMSCIALLFACKKERATKSVVEDMLALKTKKGSVTLTIDGKTYVYDDINWEKSRIKNEEDLRFTIRQDTLPQIKFRFPEIEKSLMDGQDTFDIPDIHRRGYSPITLNFIVTIKDKKRDVVTFHKGKVKVSFKNDHFVMKFEGEGNFITDKANTFPISGTININI